MRRCLIISVLMVLVSWGLPLKGESRGFPQGRYKYTPEKAAKRPPDVPKDNTVLEFVQGPTVDFEKVRDFSKNSTVYQLSRKVAHIRIDVAAFGGGFLVGSGFLVGRDLLLTNHHCVYRVINENKKLPYASQRFEQYPLDIYEVYMEYYEAGRQGRGSVSARVRSLLRSDAGLDYALLRLDRPLGNTYGWLELSEASPSPGGSVRIIQHPEGREKEVVRKHTGIVKVFEDMLHYVADTEGGSSGSPVFGISGDAVIALHRAGRRGYANEGVLMRAIVPEIRSWLPGGAASSQGAAPSGMVLIPAGEFEMGSHDRDLNADPVRTVYVEAFYMDTHEVTNEEFRRFVLANPQWQKHRIQNPEHRAPYLAHWNGNSYPTGKANHPVTYVSWYAAVAYAKWAGKRLPTEAEWEKAARGGLSGQKYPWGNTIDSGKANYGTNNVGDTTPVGHYSVNGYGLYDMAGNVWEWCSDTHGSFSGDDSYRVLRGGSWGDTARFVRCATRDYSTPTYANNFFGFRCARSVTP